MKKIIIRVLIFIAILLFITVFCFENIKRNSVYYAKNTPHKEGTEPVLMMVVDNLEWIDNPEIDGIEYDFDGGNCIYNNNLSKDSPYFAENGNGKEYIYYDGIRITYNFNSQFSLIYVYDDSYKKIPLNQFDINSVKYNIYNLLQPVIDAQRKPKVNLQWLFDIVYKDKFN